VLKLSSVTAGGMLSAVGYNGQTESVLPCHFLEWSGMVLEHQVLRGQSQVPEKPFGFFQVVVEMVVEGCGVELVALESEPWLRAGTGVRSVVAAAETQYGSSARRHVPIESPIGS